MNVAAKKLRVTQPGLSRIIAKLEDQFQGKIFERFPRGVRLTPYGTCVVDRAQHLLREIDRAEEELQAVLNGSSGILRVSATPVWMQVIMPQVVTQFQQEHPGVELVLSAKNYREGIESLRDGISDLHCGVFMKDAGWPGFFAREVATIVNFKVFAHKQHPIHELEDPRLADLSHYPWIDYDFDECAKITDPLPSLNKVLRDIEVRTGRRSGTILRTGALSLSLMQSGPYLAYLCATPKGIEHEFSLKVVPINEFKCHLEAGTISRQGSETTRPLKRFKQILRDAAAPSTL